MTHRSLPAIALLLSAFCLLPSAFSSLAQIGLPQVQQTPTPTPTPTPSPSPSPTPPPNLHQWGAVTLFHGLPSDRVHAIAQTPDGAMWFGTDGGLAKYDGRRTQAITAEGLPPGRVLALKVDDEGALWIGTENGAARFADGKFDAIKETSGKVVTALITPERGRAVMATESGIIFDCQTKQEGGSSAASRSEDNTVLTFVVRTIPDQPLQSSDKDHPGPLNITSLAFVRDTLYAGTQSRGLLAIENGEVREISGRPRSFFINALETDSRGRLWVGVRARGEESGLFDSSDPLKPGRNSTPTGPVTEITRGAGDDIWVTTDGRGAFHLVDGKSAERFTFEDSGGALRSDHVFAVFVDREDVVWFGTDKGVCRYDPHAMRAENISADAGANYVRALFRTSRGHLLAGTNSGLFVHEALSKTWRMIPELGRRIVYALGQEANGRVLVATANGLFGSPSSSDLKFTRILHDDERLLNADNTRTITQAGDSTFIGVYGVGVDRLEGTRRTLVWPTASADEGQREVISLAADATGRLVIGTGSAGVFFFDGKQTTTENGLDKLKGDAVWAVAAEGGDLWLPTGRGLYVYQAGELKEIIPGVSARSVSISADNTLAKRVWCATVGNGLFKVALDDQFGPVVSRMDVEQGLPSQRVFAVLPERESDGSESVIIATNRGIARYYPGRVPPTLAPERIISKRIHSADELRTGLLLDYPQNSLLLDVTATSSRTFPEQFQYAFALYDAAGTAIKQRLSHDAQFPMEGLGAGKYKVVARAFTKDLVASNPLSFEFSVARAPFPWTSTALAVLLLLALVALGWGYFQNRRIHRTSAELASANRELADARLQLANETETERRRIARDLHDQTLADLRNLMLSVDQSSSPFRSGTRAANSGGGQAAPVPPLNDPVRLRAEIESISQEVRRICEDLSPSALENVGLAAALQFALAHAVERAAPECRFEYDFICDDALDEKLRLPSSVQIQIYRITQEALSNICRHANAKHVKMTANVTEAGAFELTIEDDGRGFDRSEAKKTPGRGVANIRARAGMVDAEASWQKRDSGGTVFTLTREGAGASHPS